MVVKETILESALVADFLVLDMEEDSPVVLDLMDNTTELVVQRTAEDNTEVNLEFHHSTLNSEVEMDPSRGLSSIQQVAITHKIRKLKNQPNKKDFVS